MQSNHMHTLSRSRAHWANKLIAAECDCSQLCVCTNDDIWMNIKWKSHLLTSFMFFFYFRSHSQRRESKRSTRNSIDFVSIPPNATRYRNRSLDMWLTFRNLEKGKDFVKKEKKVKSIKEIARLTEVPELSVFPPFFYQNTPHQTSRNYNNVICHHFSTTKERSLFKFTFIFMIIHP